MLINLNIGRENNMVLIKIMERVHIMFNLSILLVQLSKIENN